MEKKEKKREFTNNIETISSKLRFISYESQRNERRKIETSFEERITKIFNSLNWKRSAYPRPEFTESQAK